MMGWLEVWALAALDVILWIIARQHAYPSAADQRLNKYAGPYAHDTRTQPSLWIRIGRPLVQYAVAGLRPLASPTRRARMVDQLTRAGLDWDPAVLDALKIAGAAAAIAAAAVVGHAHLPGAFAGWMTLAGGLGYLAPGVWVRSRGDERQRQFRRALPDALDVLAICLRAGLGLQAAVAEYARSASGVAAAAFRRYLADLALGRTPEEGLADLARRFPGDDLVMVAAALSQGMRFGSPIAEVLEEQAAHCRALALRRAQEEARALSTRLVLPLAVFVFPQVFIVGLGPVALRLFGPGGALR
jgi:tight adherence protein C